MILLAGLRSLLRLLLLRDQSLMSAHVHFRAQNHLRRFFDQYNQPISLLHHPNHILYAIALLGSLPLSPPLVSHRFQTGFLTGIDCLFCYRWSILVQFTVIYNIVCSLPHLCAKPQCLPHCSFPHTQHPMALTFRLVAVPKHCEGQST